MVLREGVPTAAWLCHYPPRLQSAASWLPDQGWRGHFHAPRSSWQEASFFTTWVSIGCLQHAAASPAQGNKEMRETNVEAVRVSEVAPRSFCHILLVTERAGAMWEGTQCVDPRRPNHSFSRAAVTNCHRLGGLKHQESALSQLGRLAGQYLLLVGASVTAFLPYCSSTPASASVSTRPSSWASCSYQDSRHIG